MESITTPIQNAMSPILPHIHNALDSILTHFQGDSPLLQSLGYYAYKIYSNREYIQMEIHLILSALFPIYIGSHAALRRPPSAANPPKKPAEENEDDEIDVEPIVEGLQPSDAIMFPVMGGLMLGGLYVIIKWLNDPGLLNKIMGWYFSVLGLYMVGKLASDTLNILTTLIFPTVWTCRGIAYFISPLLRIQTSGPISKSRVLQTRKDVPSKPTPLPGLLSSLPLSPSIATYLWDIRSLLSSQWIFRAYFHGLFSLKSTIKINDVLGFMIGIFVVIMYNLNDRAWYLTNILGTSFSYSTLQLLSPTTFWTGSLVLGGLFLYDITMVFYTPLMVTVATSLDVPIKLLIPSPGKGGKQMSMLGLGDIVLPGIMMALALRFDLYLHYLRLQKTITTSNPLTPSSPPTTTIQRAQYIEATSQWGDRFWTSGAPNGTVSNVDGARFKKVYFKASIVGYIIGMITTLFVMTAWKHAQPALLYLVPGVLGALWGTALLRGEIKEMWSYTEDGIWGFEAVPREDKKVGGNGKSGESDVNSKDEVVINGKDAGVLDGQDKKTSKDGGEGKDSEEEEKKKKRKERKKREKEEHAHHVFLFSLSEPKKSRGKFGMD